MSPLPTRYAGFQHLRGAAALAVVLYHVSHYLHELRGDGRFLSIFGGFFGAYGVALFFALSGYLMARVLERGDYARFLLRRIARIYPLMLITVVVFALAFLAIGKPRGVNLLALTLVPSGPRGYFLTVEWTLVLEVTYYAVLAALGLLGAGRFRTPLIAVWTVAILAAFALGPGRTEQLLPTIGQIPLGIVNLPFALGYLVADLQRRQLMPALPLWIGLLPAVGAAMAPDLPMMRLLGGLSAALVVGSLAQRSFAATHSWAARAGERMGDASYALYLSHVPVILLLAGLMPAAWSGALVWMIWLLAAIGCALALTPLDLFLQERLRNVIEALDERKARAVALVALAGFAWIAGDAEWDRAQLEATRTQIVRVLAGPAQPAGGEIRVGIDAVLRAPNGQWTLRGYAIDLAKPDVVAQVALRQDGRVVALAERPRLRPDVAATLGRPDIAKVRFGFVMALPEAFDCQGGQPELVAAFADGRAIALPREPLAALCAR